MSVLSLDKKKKVFAGFRFMKGIFNILPDFRVKTEDRLYWKFGRTFPPNTILFREGEESRQMYVIQSGGVSLTRKVGEREIEIAIIGPGEFFGEMSLLTGMKRSTTARTVGEVRILEIDDTTFESLLRTHEDVAIKMLKKFAFRINEANQYAERLVLVLWRERVILFLLLLGGVKKEIEPAEIVRESRIPEGVVLNVLKGLEDSGYIEKLEGQRYRLIDSDGLRGLVGKEEMSRYP